MEYIRESPFWYFLARRTLDQADPQLPHILEGLDHRMRELSLPTHYPPQHAVTSAVLLQLFDIAAPYFERAGKYGIAMMFAGFDHVFGPKGVAKRSFTRLLSNLRSPAFPDRSREETFVDTFLIHGRNPLDAGVASPEDEVAMMQVCLTDLSLRELGRQALQHQGDLWDTTTAEYLRRRPGFLRRQFSDPNSWLFD